MSYASGAMYVRKHFNKEDRMVALEMIADLKNAFKGMLKTNDWMDEETKKYAHQKVGENEGLVFFKWQNS